MQLFSSPAFDDHEQVVFLADRESGLRAIIAIHDTSLGPAIGGLRMWPYPDEASALTDVLRLARGMTYKSALAGLDCGGGKAVIIGDPRTGKSRALFHAFGRALEAAGGLYYTAEDVGTGPADMDAIGEASRFVLGRSAGAGGDPSPITARGVWHGIRSAVRHRLGSDLQGVRVAVQGLGHVGFEVARLVRADGARLTVADLDPRRVARAVEELGAEVVGVDGILGVETEVLAPCALGGVVDDRTLPGLRCRVIAGAANNQLLEGRHGDELHRRDILYAPDYVINAGGIISIAGELAPGGYDRDLVLRRVDRIGEVLDRIFDQSARDDLPPHVVADRLAGARLAAARERRRRAEAATLPAA
ncbi:MAG TPA: Glu/Leu/Phe/Val dehydrogenase dimerization domain-containing protein [Geminicoccaceae bacterium]